MISSLQSWLTHLEKNQGLSWDIIPQPVYPTTFFSLLLRTAKFWCPGQQELQDADLDYKQTFRAPNPFQLTAVCNNKKFNFLHAPWCGNHWEALRLGLWSRSITVVHSPPARNPGLSNILSLSGHNDYSRNGNKMHWTRTEKEDSLFPTKFLYCKGYMFGATNSHLT